MKNATFFFLLISAFLIACQSRNEAKLTIATAANMQFAMNALIEAFEEETGISCEIVIGSSGKLTAQIEEGAPFDLFVSADMKYPGRLHEKGFSIAEPGIYAYGKLVLWSMIDKLEPDLALLKEDQIKHLAVANPKTAPYGVAALEVLDHYGVSESLKSKLVYGESIAQTNQFIISKAAEIGFTSKSVVLSPQMKGQGQWQDVNQSFYTPLAQGVVILKGPKRNLTSAQAFYDFLFTEQGQKILIQFGYEVRMAG